MAKIIKKPTQPSPILHNNPIANNASYIHDGVNAGEHLTGNDNGYTFNDLLAIPNWSIEDFIAERKNYLLQGLEANNGFCEPGTFFYKVFFNFNTGYGLLGSLITDDTDKYFKDENSAWQYLTNNIKGDKFSEKYRKVLTRKRNSLEKFGQLLHYLTMQCPWFFKEVSDLPEILKYNFNEICGPEKKSFGLKFNQDAIDMRISTLIELYRDACFDYTNFKEVIPENLRLFDMCIVLCAPPTYGLNIYKKKDGITTKDVFGKTHFGGNAEDKMSFKCIICKNCEILYKDLVGMRSNVDNSEGIKMDEFEFKIGVDRVYTYTLNDELNVEILDGLFSDINEEVPTAPPAPTTDSAKTKVTTQDTKKEETSEDKETRKEKRERDAAKYIKSIKDKMKNKYTQLPDDVVNDYLNKKSPAQLKRISDKMDKGDAYVYDVCGDMLDFAKRKKK